MDINKLEELVPQLDNMKNDELLQMLKSLETLVKKTKDLITFCEEPTKPPVKNSEKNIPADIVEEFFHLLQHPDIDLLSSFIMKFPTIHSCFRRLRLSL